MWSLTLFADLRDDPLRSPEVIWGVALLVVALLVGAAAIYMVDQWRKRAVADPGDADASGALTGYRDMYENGEITEAEYTELRRRVAEKVKKHVAPKPSNAPAGTMPPLPSLQPGERTTVNPPAPPPTAPEPPAPPGTA